jgi:hypothetical protein
MRELTIGHDIGRVRKGGHPSPVFESRVPADVIGVQMCAHDIVDIVYGESGSRQALFEAIAVQHVPKRARRPRLVIADAGVDQNVVAGRLDDKALNTKHQPILNIDKFRLQPSPVLVEQFFGKFREETQCVKKRSLLLDQRMNSDLAKHQRPCHGQPPIFVRLKLYGGSGTQTGRRATTEWCSRRANAVP